MSDEIHLLHRWIDEHQGEMIEALQGVLRIPSKKEPSAGPDAPYGQPIRDALSYTLSLCSELGFRTKDVGGHAGHAEFGSGEEMIAALGHLDVVPEGDRWSYPPFGAEIRYGHIYARGAADDKGPTFAALFAAKALMECGLPIRRRVRVIFGCDEESGFGCVHHYWEVAREERPVLGFTPDAMFPLVYAEKGIANLTLERRFEHGEGLRLEWMTGGLRTNMVPDSAEARIAGPASEIEAAREALGGYWDRNVTARAQDATLVLSAHGKSAHGSTPQEGDSAVLRLSRALQTLGLPEQKELAEWVVETSDAGGSGLGIEGRDEVAGRLTCNLGVLSFKSGLARLTYNVRYPVTWSADELPNRLKKRLEGTGWALAEFTDSRPLHIPLDTEPVKTLLRVYRQETGDQETQPETMGGGTYARATPNVVAYGPGFPGGGDGPAHEPDERISIDTLVRAAKIYAHALYELAR